MSRSARRAISWVGTLAVLAGGAIGLAHLPGSGGVGDELRWLLGRDRVSPKQFNRATGLIVLAERQKAGARTALYRDLLRERDPRLVRNAITLLANEFGRGHVPDDLAAMFTEWFLASTPEQRLRYQPALLACCEPLLLFRGIDPERGTGPASQPWPLPAAVGDYRWLVAGTLWRQHAGRAFADRVVFRPNADLDWLSLRLQFLDGDAPFLESRHFSPLSAGRLTATLRPGVGQVVAMLTDTNERVRWGAGRILAAAGDPRGLPALCDWVRHNPQLIPNTDRLMTALFGPNWRALGASSRPTSEPSPSDGRR
jgi:hypothetical protein